MPPGRAATPAVDSERPGAGCGHAAFRVSPARSWTWLAGYPTAGRVIIRRKATRRLWPRSNRLKRICRRRRHRRLYRAKYSSYRRSGVPGRSEPRRWRHSPVRSAGSGPMPDLPSGTVRSRQPSLPLSLHQLHSLRPPLQHPRRLAVRPRTHGHGGFSALCRVP